MSTQLARTMYASKLSGVPCTACLKSSPLPALICFGCSEGRDVQGRVQHSIYCSTGCAARDAEGHRDVCEKRNIRKQLFRAGELLHAVLYTFRRRTFDLNIARIEKRSDVLYIHDGKYSNSQVHSPFFALSDKMVATQEDLQAILSFQICGDAVAWLSHMCSKLLESMSLLNVMLMYTNNFTEIATTIEEAGVDLDERHQKVQRILENGTPVGFSRGHAVFGIECCDGESYIIDVSGAQYRQFRPVMTLDSYMTRMNPQIRRVWPSGYHLATRAEKLAQVPAGMGILGPVIQSLLIPSLNCAFDTWIDFQEKTIPEILSSPGRAFEESTKLLVSAVAAAIERGMEPMHDRVKNIKQAINSLKLSDEFEEKVTRPLNSTPSNRKQGSRLVQKSLEQQAEMIKAMNPGAWESVYAPVLAKGGTVHFI